MLAEVCGLCRLSSCMVGWTELSEWKSGGWVLYIATAASSGWAALCSAAAAAAARDPLERDCGVRERAHNVDISLYS